MAITAEAQAPKRRTLAPASDPTPSDENLFAAPVSFSVGEPPAVPPTKKELRRRRRARDKWATHDLADVWSSLDNLNEAADPGALRGISLDADLAAAFETLVDLDAEDAAYAPPPRAASFAAPGDATFGGIAPEDLAFGESILPETTAEFLGPYRDAVTSDDEGGGAASDDASDACPDIDDVLAEEAAKAEAFQTRRLGETPAPEEKVSPAKAKTTKKPAKSPSCVADFADLQSQPSVDPSELEKAIDRPVVYPRAPRRMPDAEAERLGREYKQELDRKREKKERREETKRIREIRKNAGLATSDDSDDDGGGAAEAKDDFVSKYDTPTPDLDAYASGDDSGAEEAKSPPPWNDDLSATENLERALAALRVKAPFADADVEGTVAEARVGQIPDDDVDEQDAENPGLLSLLDDGIDPGPGHL